MEFAGGGAECSRRMALPLRDAARPASRAHGSRSYIQNDKAALRRVVKREDGTPGRLR